jgi:hypothetical protein
LQGFKRRNKMRKEIEKRTAHKPKTSIFVLRTVQESRLDLGRRGHLAPCWHIPIPRTHRCKRTRESLPRIIDHCQGSTHTVMKRSKKTKTFESFALAEMEMASLWVSWGHERLRQSHSQKHSIWELRSHGMDWQNSWSDRLNNLFS